MQMHLVVPGQQQAEEVEVKQRDQEGVGLGPVEQAPLAEAA